ncbi:transcription initiation factor TFIID component TAF4 [Pyronema omphalodes]|nr:transcription initiation factor TFIID component TAF4 [Pyronema omphalodes]
MQYHPQQQQQQFQQQQQQQQQIPPQQQQQQQAMNSMPPPTAPASKPTDPTDLADALTSAGIDLKEEEARLAQFSNTGFQHGYNVDPYTGQPLSAEDAMRIEHRRRAALKANHLNDPFLHPNVLAGILANKTRAENCNQFVFDASGAGHDIVTLLSLAASERLKTLLTRSTALAKVRRRPQTTITGEWADRIAGATTEGGTNATSSSPKNNLKRGPSGTLGLGAPDQPTATLQNATARALRQLKQTEYERDQARQRKRAKREASLLASGGASSTPGTPSAPGADTAPGTPTMEPKVSLKESRKQQASKIEEAASHRAANATANMMMGGFGGAFGLGGKKKKKTYSWMNAGGGPGGGMVGARAGPVLGGPGLGGIMEGGNQVQGDLGGLNWTGQRLGVWREDGERGKGIQIRDWVGALEGDGRTGGKSVVRAYLRMK